MSHVNLQKVSVSRPYYSPAVFVYGVLEELCRVAACAKDKALAPATRIKHAGDVRIEPKSNVALACL